MYNGNIKPLEKKAGLASPTMHGDELKYLKEAAETDCVGAAGENLDMAGEMVAGQAGVKCAVALNSGTAALHLALKLAGEKVYGKPEAGKGVLQGKRVICSDMTFAATCNPIIYEGGVPVFIDTDPETWNMDTVALDLALEMYPDVKIVVYAELYGFPGRVDEIKRICEKYGALLIEDAAEAFGAAVDGKVCGSFGDFGALSFNGNKIITGGGGGFLLTDDAEAAEKARKWAAQSKEDTPWDQHEETGYSYAMSNVTAGVVRGQFPYLEEHIARKKAIYERYKEGLADLPVKMNPITEGTAPNYWLSAMIIDREAMCMSIRSDKSAKYAKESGKTCPTEVLEALASINAEGAPVRKPLHMQPLFMKNEMVENEGINALAKEYINGIVRKLGEDIFKRALVLPSDIKMTPEEQDRVIETIRACFE